MAKEEDKDMETSIIEAARSVFVRKGYDQATMSDIAREAGIGRTALHYYFRTKEMLFEAIFGQLMTSLLPNITRIIEQEEETTTGKLEKIIDQYLLVLQENLLFPIFVVNEMNRDPEHLYSVVLKDPDKILPVLKLRDEIEREMEKGTLRRIGMPDLVSSLIGALVFPILARHPLSEMFFGGDMDKFREYIAGRGPYMKESVRRILAPDL